MVNFSKQKKKLSLSHDKESLRITKILMYQRIFIYLRKRVSE